jgi:hypothetical protein
MGQGPGARTYRQVLQRSANHSREAYGQRRCDNRLQKGAMARHSGFAPCGP